MPNMASEQGIQVTKSKKASKESLRRRQKVRLTAT